MYLEFILPQGAGGMAAAHSNHLIKKALKQWSEQYDIPYTLKNVKYTLRVFFTKPDHYSFFALTWAPEPVTYSVNRWSLVEPMQRPKSIDKLK